MRKYKKGLTGHPFRYDNYYLEKFLLIEIFKANYMSNTALTYHLIVFQTHTLFASSTQVPLEARTEVAPKLSNYHEKQ